MGAYALFRDANGNPIIEGRFYIHINTKEEVQLFKGPGSFWQKGLSYVLDPNLLNPSDVSQYRLMDEKDFRRGIRKCEIKKSCLEAGLAALDKLSAPKGGSSFNQRMAAMDGEDDYLSLDDEPMGP